MCAIATEKACVDECFQGRVIIKLSHSSHKPNISFYKTLLNNSVSLYGIIILIKDRIPKCLCFLSLKNKWQGGPQVAHLEEAQQRGAQGKSYGASSHPGCSK